MHQKIPEGVDRYHFCLPMMLCTSFLSCHLLRVIFLPYSILLKCSIEKYFSRAFKQDSSDVPI